MIASLIANSLALASLLIMLSSGLALIYGLRGVINFGHGAIYMLGAYLGYTVALFGGFWLALIVVPILLALLGIAFEFLVLRPLQGRSHIEVALVTLGLGIVLGQIIIFFYGGVARSVDAPGLLSGSVDVFGLTYPVYRIFLIAVGLGSCALLALWLSFTTSGLNVRAVSQDPSVARMMGINADRLSLLVTLAGLGQLDVAADAIEELRVVARLQRRDRMAHRGLCEVQRLGGSSDVLAFSDRDEDAELLEGHFDFLCDSIWGRDPSGSLPAANRPLRN